MIYQYVVILKKNSERTTDLLSILLCLFSALGFLYLSFYTGHLQYIPLIMALVLLTGLAINLVMARRGGVRVRYRYWLLAAGIGWIGTTPIPWVGALFFLQGGFTMYRGQVQNYNQARESDTHLFARFFWEMLARGVYLPCSQFEAAFVSAAHTDDDIDRTIEAAREALAVARG